MSDSARSSHPTKRSLDAIDGDDSANQQPSEKSVRREAGPVSPEVLDIHQKLAKLDNEKQAAIRFACEMQARVEYLEKLTEEKLALVDGEEKKLVEELQEKVRSLSKQLEEERLQSKQNRKRYRTKIDNLQSNRDELTRVLAEAEANDDNARKRMEEQHEKIDELTSKLAQYEGGQQQIQPTPQQPSEAVQEQHVKAEVDTSTDDSSLANIEETNTCPNLFDIVPTESEEGSVEFSTAVSALDSYQNNSMQSYEGSVGEFEERRKEVLKDEKLYCALCKKTFEKEEILGHFFSGQHETEVTAECNRKCQPAFIDCSPFVFWMRKLESMAKQTIAVVTPIKTESIVYAAPGAIDGASEDEDVEDEDLDEDYEDDEDDVSTDIEVE